MALSCSLSLLLLFFSLKDLKGQLQAPPLCLSQRTTFKPQPPIPPFYHYSFSPYQNQGKWKIPTSSSDFSSETASELAGQGLDFCHIDIIFGMVIGLVRAASGLELEPPSDEPYLSTSLQNFWGRRWNLTVTYLLRHTVYKPVRSIFDDVLGSGWGPLPALLATFLVSGLMHELLFYYITPVGPSWEMTWFFVLHGACVAVEIGVKRVFSGRVQLHPAVSTPLTVGFVVGTAMWLFFPPLTRSGAVEKAMEEIKAVLDFSEVIKRCILKSNHVGG
ncbi:hypothetical protein V6N13_049571 [Hibiscus sabdariffa]|uniref:Wax synthase domain-containing protein n=1 Tax=Hibiscus sabdariffa TaxID=183260 RepID=A0ABR2QX66_9ROSI